MTASPTDRDAVGISTGLPETVLDDAPAVARERLEQALSMPPGQRREAVSDVVRSFPWWSDAWAELGDLSRDDVEAYACFRVGYHRGLDSCAVRMARKRIRALATALEPGFPAGASTDFVPRRPRSGRPKKRSAAQSSSASSIRRGRPDPGRSRARRKVRSPASMHRHLGRPSRSSSRSSGVVALLAACGTRPRPRKGSLLGRLERPDADIAQIRADAANVAKVEKIGNPGAIRTNCAVLDLDTENANQNLPSPDQQLTTELSDAYTAEIQAAQDCFHGAGKSESCSVGGRSRRARADADIDQALALGVRADFEVLT